MADEGEARPNDYFEKKTIQGKEIFIVEKHQYALKAWAGIRNSIGVPTYLITFDNHSDSHPALTDWCTIKMNNGIHETKKIVDCVDKILTAVNVLNSKALEDLISKLRHDEHIDTALRLNIIKKVFSINFQNQSEDKNFIEVWEEIQSELRDSQNTDCSRNDILEDVFLDALVRVIDSKLNANRVNGIFDEKYIMDIDCDVFHESSALSPSNYQIFYRLIQNAECITIALETEFVENSEIDCDDNDLKDEDDWYECGLTSEWIKNQLVEHIKAALSKRGT